MKTCWHGRAIYRMVTDTIWCPDCGGVWPEAVFTQQQADRKAKPPKSAA